MGKSKTGGDSDNGDKSSPPETTASTSSGTPVVLQENDNISTRVGARTKKAKVVFDPSDNYVPRKRVRKSDVAPTEACTLVQPTKFQPIATKSPVKVEKNHDNNSNGSLSAPKSRASLSPSFMKQSPSHNHKTKILGSASSPELERLAGPSNDSSAVASATHKQDIKREPYCDMCHKIEQQRRGFKLIDCLSCSFRAHSKCLRAHPVFSKFPIQLNFRCFQCIECVVCGKLLRGGNLLFCCDCQNAFHKSCHGPSTSDSSPNAPWICKRCTNENISAKQSRSQNSAPPLREAALENADDEAHQEFAGFSDNEIRKDSLSISDGTGNDSCSQPQTSQAEENEVAAAAVAANDSHTNQNDEDKFDPRLDNFEDVQNWSCDDVYRYFKHYFPDYAHLFKEQEIDGSSLVLMRKSDVLSGFGIKVGPAIFLYQRIVMMQNNDRDFRLTWT
ncbi:integrator complex subunit 12 [Toxorhynchites rutilus septentrionalis]|uniref:integrator complex subunit 12 n=1 Tax=Toxorhynchites rutilus septentrionalis TaxID=329112 RepID=UPI002479E326|nr:integrator complex subunit 12 [Toxorhynchites rutilus septentrionalis]